MNGGYFDGQKADFFKKKLFDDVYVNEVLDVLALFDRQQEKVTFVQVLSKIDEMYELFQTNEKSFHVLEEDIHKLEDSKAKNLLTEILDETKVEYNAYKNKYIDQKVEVIERCQFLVETFKESGQVAFYKAFEGACNAFKRING